MNASEPEVVLLTASVNAAPLVAGVMAGGVEAQVEGGGFAPAMQAMITGLL
jgi:hypothetical protein